MQGLVTVSPQRGIVVRDLSARDIAELFDIRSAVEPFVVGQLARSALTADQRERVRTNLSRQHRAATEGDALECTRLDIAFHRLLAELLDNRERSAEFWLDALASDRLHRSVLRVNRLAKKSVTQELQGTRGSGCGGVLGGHSRRGRPADEVHLSFGRQFLLVGEAHIRDRLRMTIRYTFPARSSTCGCG